VGVNVPETTDDLLTHQLQLANISVATSGDAYQYMEKNGVKYSHILNPKTGFGVTWLRNVTIIAAKGETADWLATACSILPLEEAKKLALDNQAQLLITTLQNGQITYYSSPSFKKYWRPINTNQK
jgi:thiamine biosynthesis lipoprotein